MILLLLTNKLVDKSVQLWKIPEIVVFSSHSVFRICSGDVVGILIQSVPHLNVFMSLR